MESIDGDGDFGVDLDFSGVEGGPSGVLKFTDLGYAPGVPVVSGLIDFESGVNLDDFDFLFNLESPFNSNGGDLCSRDRDDDIDLVLGVNVDSGGLRSEPDGGVGLNVENEDVDVIPDFHFHSNSVGFSSGLQLEDESSGLGINSGLSFGEEFSGSSGEADFELPDEFFESHIPSVLVISAVDGPSLS